MKRDIINESILVVGANGALAKETIKQLLHDGATKITMACRTATKGEEAKEEILNEFGKKDHVELSVIGGFDMTNPLMIEKAIQELPSDKPFDIIFLAAGFAVFTDGYQAVNWKGKKVEKNVFQNMVGSHLTFLGLKKAGLIAKGARVVLAGGEGSRGIKGMIESPNFTSAQELRDYIYLNDAPKYNPMNAIGVSKFCGALWTSKISELEKNNMEIIWFSPGLTSGSSGLKTLPPVKRWFMNNIMFGILGLMGQSQSPSEGGRKNADCLEGKIGANGNLLGAPAGKSIGKITDQTPLNPLFSNQDMIDEFWSILGELMK